MEVELQDVELERVNEGIGSREENMEVEELKKIYDRSPREWMKVNKVGERVENGKEKVEERRGRWREWTQSNRVAENRWNRRKENVEKGEMEKVEGEGRNSWM